MRGITILLKHEKKTMYYYFIQKNGPSTGIWEPFILARLIHWISSVKQADEDKLFDDMDKVAFEVGGRACHTIKLQVGM